MSVVQQKAMACAACGGATVQPFDVNGEFCSKTCFVAGRAFCKFCNKPLEHPIHGLKRKFCNDTCMYRYRSRGTVTKSLTEEKQRTECKACGKPVKQSKNGLRFFCSQNCCTDYHKAEVRGQDISAKWGSYGPETRKLLCELEDVRMPGLARRLAIAIDREYRLRRSGIPRSESERYISYTCKTCGGVFRRTPWSHQSKDYCSNRCTPFDRQIGETNTAARLTWREVDEIRRLYEMKQFSQTQLARRYGVSQTSIWHIVHYTQWKPENDPRRKAKLAQAQQAMATAGLPPGVPGTPVLPGQVYPPPAPAPGQPAGAQPGQAPPQGGKL